MCRRFRTDSLASPKAIYAKRLGRSSSNRSGCNGMLLKAQQCERERLKKAGHIVPWVFFRIVAEGRRGPKKPRQILTLTKAWRAACAAAGHPGIILHDLRRSAVRNMVRRGIAEGEAMQLVRHKTRSMLDRYNIIDRRDLQNATAKLEGVAGAMTTKRRARAAIVVGIASGRR